VNDEPLTRRQGVAMFLTSLALSPVLAWGVSEQVTHSNKRALEEVAIEQCELKTQDRVDNARGWTELERYYKHIATNAPSVQRDVTAIVRRGCGWWWASPRISYARGCWSASRS
jgi:hypothetical protein